MTAIYGISFLPRGIMDVYCSVIRICFTSVDVVRTGLNALRKASVYFTRLWTVKAIRWCLTDYIFEPVKESQLDIVWFPTLQLKVHDVQIKTSALEELRCAILTSAKMPPLVYQWISTAQCTRAYIGCVRWKPYWNDVHLDRLEFNVEGQWNRKEEIDHSTASDGMLQDPLGVPKRRAALTDEWEYLVLCFLATIKFHFSRPVISAWAVTYPPSIHAPMAPIFRLGTLCRANTVTIGTLTGSFLARQHSLALVAGIWSITALDSRRPAKKRVLARLFVGTHPKAHSHKCSSTSNGAASTRLNWSWDTFSQSVSISLPVVQVFLSEMLIPSVFVFLRRSSIPSTGPLSRRNSNNTIRSARTSSPSSVDFGNHNVCLSDCDSNRTNDSATNAHFPIKYVRTRKNSLRCNVDKAEASKERTLSQWNVPTTLDASWIKCLPDSAVCERLPSISESDYCTRWSSTDETRGRINQKRKGMPRVSPYVSSGMSDWDTIDFARTEKDKRCPSYRPTRKFSSFRSDTGTSSSTLQHTCHSSLQAAAPPVSHNNDLDNDFFSVNTPSSEEFVCRCRSTSTAKPDAVYGLEQEQENVPLRYISRLCTVKVHCVGGVVVLCGSAGAALRKLRRVTSACCIHYAELNLEIITEPRANADGNRLTVTTLRCAETIYMDAVDISWPPSVRQLPNQQKDAEKPLLFWLQRDSSRRHESLPTTDILEHNEAELPLMLRFTPTTCSVALGSVFCLLCNDTLAPFSAMATFCASWMASPSLFSRTESLGPPRWHRTYTCKVQRIKVVAVHFVCHSKDPTWCSVVLIDMTLHINFLLKLQTRIDAHFIGRVGFGRDTRQCFLTSSASLCDMGNNDSSGFFSQSTNTMREEVDISQEATPSKWIAELTRQSLNANSQPLLPAGFKLMFHIPHVYSTYHMEVSHWASELLSGIAHWIAFIAPAVGPEAVFNWAGDELLVALICDLWCLTIKPFNVPLITRFSGLRINLRSRLPRTPFSLSLWPCRVRLLCTGVLGHIAGGDSEPAFLIVQRPGNIGDGYHVSSASPVLVNDTRIRNGQIERISITVERILIDLRRRILLLLLKCSRWLIWQHKVTEYESMSPTYPRTNSKELSFHHKSVKVINSATRPHSLSKTSSTRERRMPFQCQVVVRNAQLTWALRVRSPLVFWDIDRIRWTYNGDYNVFDEVTIRVGLSKIRGPPRLAVQLAACTQMAVTQTRVQTFYDDANRHLNQPANAHQQGWKVTSQQLTLVLSVVTLDIVDETCRLLRRSGYLAYPPSCDVVLPDTYTDVGFHVESVSVTLSPLCWAHVPSGATQPHGWFPRIAELVATGLRFESQRLMPSVSRLYLSYPAMSSHATPAADHQLSPIPTSLFTRRFSDGAFHFRILDQQLECQRSTLCVGLVTFCVESFTIRDLVRASKFAYFASSVKEQALDVQVREIFVFRTIPSLTLCASSHESAILHNSVRQCRSNMSLPDSQHLDRILSSEPWTWLAGREDHYHPPSQDGARPGISRANRFSENLTYMPDLQFTLDVSVVIQPVRITADQRFLNALETFQRRFAFWVQDPTRRNQRPKRCTHTPYQRRGPNIRYLTISVIAMNIDFQPAVISTASRRRSAYGARQEPRHWLRKRVVNRVLTPIGGIQQLTITLPEQTLRGIPLYHPNLFCNICATHNCSYCCERDTIIFGTATAPALRNTFLVQLVAPRFWSRILERLVRGGWASALDVSRLARAVVIHATSIQSFRRVGVSAAAFVHDVAALRVRTADGTPAPSHWRHLPVTVHTLLRHCTIEAVYISAKVAGAAHSALRSAERCAVRATQRHRRRRKNNIAYHQRVSGHCSTLAWHSNNTTTTPYDDTPWSLVERGAIRPVYEMRTVSQAVVGAYRTMSGGVFAAADAVRHVHLQSDRVKLTHIFAETLKMLPLLLLRPLAGLADALAGTLQLAYCSLDNSRRLALEYTFKHPEILHSFVDQSDSDNQEPTVGAPGY